MSQSDDQASGHPRSGMDTTDTSPGLVDRRRFPGTDMPIGLMALAVVAGLPRTVLADLDVVPPESGLLYYVIALAPFAVWLAVAILHPSRRPLRDFAVLGLLYGLSLILVHQVLWNSGSSPGHQPPASAIDFANRFDSGWHDLALRVYTSGIAMIIGLGTGLVIALVAVAARAWRSKRARRDGH